ncbi:MAG: XisH family protein [Blastocatellia bacterium]|nr:XisH family protein [Blastocatellia bacterium]
MSRRDTYHDIVRTALVKDGWHVTHDPLAITYEGTTVSTDLGAEKATTLQAQHIAVEIIAVEVKDFDSRSLISEFEKALGQYRLYRALLRRNDPNRVLFLAIRETIYNTFFQLPAIQAVTADDDVRLIVFDEQKEEIVLWIK